MEWILVKENLPENYVKVLTYYKSENGNCFMDVDYVEPNLNGYRNFKRNWNVTTYWQPLPLKPKN